MLFCPFRILYKTQFILMATSLGTNAVVETRLHCSKICTLEGSLEGKISRGLFVSVEVLWPSQPNGVM